MPKAIAVRNLEDSLAARLKIRAARHGRSAEAEVRAILAEALKGEPREDFWTVAARLRVLTKGRRHTPAEELVREGREER